MIELADVTLLAADTANHALALRALRRSMAHIRFARVAWLTDAVPASLAVGAGIDVVPIVPLRSRTDYSQLMLKSLAAHVTTSHVLVVQWDGHVINAAAWDSQFLACDYVGAKWFWHKDGMNVGNGGFSLRSRKLLLALADPRIDGDDAEDEIVCRRFRPLLERDYGIRFGDEAMADHFSFEAMHPVGKPFGFHGLYNFARVMRDDEIAALVPQFSDAIARSPQCLQLLRNARALGQWLAVAALGARMLRADPAQPDALAAVADARRRDNPYAGVSRNDRCPCGSGRRFKECHGRVEHAAAALSPPAVASGEALQARGLRAHRAGDLDAAERDYRAALAVDPGAMQAAHYLGVVHYQRGRFDDALPLIERSLREVPREAEFHNNAGLLYTAMDRIDAAVDAFRQVLALRPDHKAAWNNLGLALVQRNDLTLAADAYRSALAVDAQFAEARWNLALALLAQGDFANGWAHYDARLEITALGADAAPIAGTRYRGEPLRDRTLLLSAEQGYGDTLQFIRFAQVFATRGARVIVETPPALAALCASAPGVSQVVATGGALPAHDYCLPLLSSARALALDAAGIATPIPYLHADSARVAHWTSVVAAHPARLRVGLSWAGNPRHANDRRRSIALAMFAPLFALQGVAWYSLQHVDGEAQIGTMPAAHAMHLLDARHNFDDKAALIAALDLVISVDTANAHLAGALGAPLWVLLPYAADWRWGVACTTTAWYPKARLIRQRASRDWHEPLRDVQDALRARLSG
ncbi:MAG: DUF5672 family protein [Casimicrobiaceae bacterium]